MKKIFVGVITLVAVVAVGIGTYAAWSDLESSKGNTLSAGSFDLQIGPENESADLSVAPTITVSNVYPGVGPASAFDSYINNEGTIPISAVNFNVSSISSRENTLLDPELETGDNSDKGELCDQLQVKVTADANNDGDLTDEGDVLADWNSLTAINNLSLGSLAADTESSDSRKMKIEYRVPDSADNAIMTDSCSFDLEFNAVQ